MRQKIRKGKLEACKLLLKRGFRINVRRELYKSALN